MKYEKTCRIMAGGIFFLANSLLTSCDDPPDTQTGQYEDSNVMAVKDAGVMTEVQEVAPDEYRIMNEYPSSRTGVVVNRLNGTKENLTEEQVQNATARSGREGGFGLGTVLSSGLLGYMMGKNTSLNPYVYRDNNMYTQSLANRNVLMERMKEGERGNRWNSRTYWYGRSGGSMSSRGVSSSSAQSGKTGFFSRMTGSFSGFSG